jgi:uncharacterized Zn-binding protein involved in type VI secretion
MPGVTRWGDVSCGIDCPPTPAVESSGNVFVNGRGVVRVGDAFKPHCKHSRVVASGSHNVYVNGRQVCRIGDKLSCGDIVCEGSSNVFVGG